MSSLGLIIQREYYERVKKRSFIFMTLLSPLLVITLLTVPFALSEGMVLWGNTSMSTAEAAQCYAIAASLAIYLFLLAYGMMVMQSVLQEKRNRVVEIMLVSISPFRLMMGKIIAVFLVGLTQLAIWGVYLLLYGVLSVQEFGTMGIPLLSATDILSFTLCFTGGYFMYAAIFAAIGAMIGSESDTQLFLLPVTLLILAALYAGIYSASQPESAVAIIGTYLPFTSPIVVMARWPYGVMWWELVLSWGLLYTTAYASTAVAAYVYRQRIIRYGR